MLCLSGLLGRLEGEIREQCLVMFCMEPGGEELGVMTWDRTTGEVFRVRGNIGICFHLRWSDFTLSNLFNILSMN